MKRSMVGRLDIVGWWKGFDGPFTKEGSLFDWGEVHSFVLGFMSGVGRSGLKESFESNSEMVDYELEWHYFKSGYMCGNRLKFVFAGGAAVYGSQSVL